MSEKKSQQDEGLLGDMTRHDAVMFLVNTALQLKQEGLPIRVTHKGNSIFFRNHWNNGLAGLYVQ